MILLAPMLLRAQDISQTQRMQWWQDAKFGLFMHWGLYSATAGDWKGHKTSRGEQFMMVEKIPVKEYATIADTFNPIHFDAERWAKMAKNAGMKYVIITSKHHDGFAMYNSPSSEYNIVKKTPYAHDPMKDLVEACHRNGLKFGFYYSLGRDWEDPDAKTNWPVKGGRSNTWDFPNEDAKDVTKYFKRKVMPQVKELLTQYGTLDILWFDTPELTPKWESKALMDTIRKYQPTCIVNNRVGNGLGDYIVNEQSIEKGKVLRPWESCVTISENWAYNWHDSAWKSANVLVRQLVDIVSKGGNYLLNLSPKGDGTFAKEAMSRIDSVGKWLRINGDAIYQTRPWIKDVEIDSSHMIVEQQKVLTAAEKDAKDAVNDATSKALFPEIRFTQKSENKIFAIACNPYSPHLLIRSLSTDLVAPIKNVILLGNKKKFKWQQTKNGLAMDIPAKFKTEVPVYTFQIIL